MISKLTLKYYEGNGKSKVPIFRGKGYFSGTLQGLKIVATADLLSTRFNKL